MSSAKRALLQAVRSWLKAEGPAPRLLRRCDVCGEQSWRPLERAIRAVTRVQVDARLAGGRRADLALMDREGRPRLLVMLEGGSRLRDRADTASDVPMIVLDGVTAPVEPLAWRPLRAHGLRPWRCRCALARTLPVDDGFSLRVIGCPINLRREDSRDESRAAAQSYALVIQDCGRCAFFVGIGYQDDDRRRVSLYCAFGSRLHDRIGPSPVSRRRLVRARPAGALRAVAPASSP